MGSAEEPEPPQGTASPKEPEHHELAQQMQEARQELDAIAHSISHDLRSPLGAILNFAALLDEDFRDRLDGEGREWLGRISHNARVVVSRMEALLSFTRSGVQAMELAACDVDGIARDVVAGLAPTSRASVTLGSLPSCRADAAGLGLVFAQLLSNAFKFTAVVPSPAIELGGRETPEECVYFVRDNGVGFEMKDAHKVFEAFRRLHAHFEGDGMGLAIARRIVQRHGGRIWAESAPERGATFFFSLPKGSAA